MPTSRGAGASADRWVPALLGWAIGGALVGFGILTGLSVGFVALAMGIPVLLWVAARAPQLRIPGGLAAVAGAGMAVAATGAFLVRGEGLFTPQSLVVAGMLPTLLALGALTLWWKVNPPRAVEARRLGPVWIAVLVAGLVLAVVAVVSLLAPPRTAETVQVEAAASLR